MMKHGMVIVFLALALMGLSGCRERATAPDAVSAHPENVMKVSAALAEARTIDRRIEIVGTLLPDDEVVVGAEVEGTVARVNVDLGSFVRRGQILAEIDRREFQLRLEQARAALAEARARLGLRPGQGDEIDPERTPLVEQARAAYEDARSKYESARRLYATGDIPEQRYIEAEKTFQARRAAYRAAIDSVRNQLAGLRRLRAQVALAEKELSDTIIRAPITGSVTVKHISAGEYLKRGAPVVTLVKLTPLRLRASVPEPYAAAVTVGRELRFTVDAVKGETFRGRVTRISPSVNPETRSLVIEAEIDNRDFKLRPGYFARAELVVEPNARVVLIPSRAVVRYVGLTRVYVIEDGRAVERSVKLGTEVDGWIEVVEGVRAGEQVITSNLSRVKNGQPVEVESSNDPVSRVIGKAVRL